MLIKRIGEFFLDILEVIVFAVAIFLFVYLLIFQPHKIKGASMEPNYPDGEYLLTDKLSYRFHEPQRGDVIVFEAPGTINEEFIKRIIGLPGDKVSIVDNHVYVNDKKLAEGYLASTLITTPGVFLKQDEEITVPADSYFVLGDNRPLSSDSRTWGYVPKKSITGKAWFIYWPPKSIGLVAKTTYPN